MGNKQPVGVFFDDIEYTFVYTLDGTESAIKRDDTPWDIKTSFPASLSQGVSPYNFSYVNHRYFGAGAIR
jgi:hypothetical protein